MNATIIIPTYQERGNIERVVREVLPRDERLHVLVVDDNSPDGTADVARGLIPEFPGRLEVARRERKFGLGPAYIYGFARALESGADLILEMDADLSHPPDQLPAMLAASESADLVIGSRYVDGGGVQNWPLSRRLISHLGNLYARAILLPGVHDFTAGFKCYHRQVLETIDIWSIRSTGYAFQIETTWRAVRAGFTVREIPITFVEREVGVSKMSRAIMLEAARMVWQLRFMRLPVRKPTCTER